MNYSKAYTGLTTIKTVRIRTIVAYILLFLVSLCFIIEHIPYLEGDLFELVENAEKEKETKEKMEKKVVHFSNFLCDYLDLRKDNSELSHRILAISRAIYIDITTPPPRLV